MDLVSIVSAIISLIIAVVSAVVAAISSLLAFYSYNEAKRARKSLRQPELVVKSLLNQLIIKNVGPGAAFNVWVKISTYQWDELISAGSGPFMYAYVLSGEEVSMKSEVPVGDGERREIELKFESIYKEKFTLEFSEEVDLEGTQKRSVLLKNSRI